MLSRPVGVHWCGWQSDTLRLQQCGWNLAVECEFHRDSYRLAMRHDALDLYALTDALTLRRDHDALYRGELADAPIFQVCHVAPKIQTRIIHGFDFRNFKTMDATPCVVTDQIQCIEDMNVFNVVGQREQVLIDKADMSVVDHLEAIKALQSPKQREIRDRMQREPQTASAPRLHLVAQLVHYAEAA